MVTRLALTVAVKSESASINVFKFVAVWLLLDVVWNLPLVADVAEVKVVVVPSAFVKTILVPSAMFAKSVTVIVALPNLPPNICLCQAVTCCSIVTGKQELF